jgi:hypothetical protein
MKDKLATRVAQLSTAIRKRGNAGFATTYAYEPIDFLEVDQGSLYAVFEIEEGSGSEGLQIADLISGVLRKEYYRDLNRDPFASLEAALHQINEELGSVAEQNNVAWIGKLNAAVAVLEGQMLHVSHVGKAAAHLLRAGKLTDITKGLDDDTDPLKTFANIATGDLAAGDKLMLSTGDLIPALDERHVASIFAELSPARTIGTLAEELDDKEFERIGAVFVEILTEEQLSRQYVENDPDEIILERGGRLESFRENAAPMIGGLASSAAAAANKAKAMTQGNGGIAGRLKDHGAHKKEAAENEQRFHDEFDETPAPATEEKRPITEKFKETNFTERAKTVKNVGTPLVDRVENMLPKKMPNVPKVKLPTAPSIPYLNGYLASGVLVLILIVSLVFLGAKHHGDSSVNKEVAALQRASLLEQSAGADILTKQYDQASQAITQARSALAPVLHSKDATRRSEAAGISAKLDNDQELASQVSIVSVKPVADFTSLNKSANPTGLALLGGFLYTADTSTGAVYRFNLTSHKVEQVSPGNKTHPIAASSRAGAAIFLTKPVGITETTTGGATTTIKPTFGSWPSAAVDVTSFSNNLYLLDPDSGTVYKAIKTTGAYGNPSIALDSSSGPSIKDAKAMAIDGNIYVLQHNNSILKFNSGKQQSFSLSGLPQPLKSPNRILINANLADLYILDPGTHRVVVTDETGKYLKGYASDSWSKADGLWADEDKGLIWVLSGGKLYQFPM